MKINICKFQLIEICNLNYGVYDPVNKFFSKKDFLDVINNNSFEKNFFPFPIYFNIEDKYYKKIKKNSLLEVFFENIYVCNNLQL